MKTVKQILFSAAVVSTLAVAPKAFAQTVTPVDQLESEMDKLTDVYDDIVPVAIGAAGFSIGMVLIKRIAFS